MIKKVYISCQFLSSPSIEFYRTLLLVTLKISAFIKTTHLYRGCKLQWE